MRAGIAADGAGREPGAGKAVALVLAAGAGSRFGGAKQLAALDGRPLLEHALSAVAQAPGLDRSIVVLGAGAEDVLATVDLYGAEPVVCAGWAEGLSASLRAGIAAAGADTGAVVVVLGDQPRIAPAAIAAVLGALRAGGCDAARASYHGRPGHPVALGPALLARAAELRGDSGFGPLLRGTHVRDVPCDEFGSADDVDTRSQLEAMQR